MLLQSSHQLLVVNKKVSFHLNHNKILGGNTMQMQVALEARTWIKSNQSLLFIVVRLLKKPILEPCKKDDESISEGNEEVESEHCKENIDSSLALPFLYTMTKQRKINHNSEIFQSFKQVRINIPLLDDIK